MHNPTVVQQLRGRLVRLGCPAAKVKRVVQEMAEHWEDARREGLEEGCSEAEAEQRATSRLGDPHALAQHFMTSVRQAHWCGRHRMFAFTVLPAISFFVWFLGWILLGNCLDQYLHLTGVGVKGAKPDLALIKLGVSSAYYSGIVAVPVFFCWLAWKRCCGLVAILLVCGSCSLHGLFNHLIVTRDHVLWRYGFATPNWANLMAPLVIGAVAWWICGGRQIIARPTFRAGWRHLTPVGWLLGLAVLLPGCAANHIAHQRGWIGGEYKLARSPKRFLPGHTVPAFPRQLEKKQSAGILVTAVPSQSPAHLADLRPGDLILQLDAQPMTSLSSFRRAVDGNQGRAVAVTVFRDGEMLERTVIVGREQYEDWHQFRIETPAFRELDLWPNPDFSLVVIGYKRNQHRIDMSTPEIQFIQRYGHASAGTNTTMRSVNSSEGWSFWLPLIEFGGFKRLLTQQTPPSPDTAR